MKALLGTNVAVIFDVGANIGNWALMAHNIYPDAKIHCFELVPQTCEVLRQRTALSDKIIVNDVGLSHIEGEVKVKHFSQDPSLSSIIDYPYPLPSATFKGRVITGDSYIEKHEIQHIDFLKIDVEGAESLVLKGFDRLISQRRVSVVQFEYGYSSILSRFLLHDFYEFFSPRGYTLGKIYPKYVDFRDYRLTDEDFIGPNYLAVSSARDDLLERFSLT